MKKAQSILIKRVIVGVIIFFIPMIIKFVIGMLGENTNNACMESFTNPGAAMERANELKNSSSSGGGSSAGNNIVSQSDCEARGEDYVLLTNPQDINLFGTNCYNDETPDIQEIQ